MAPLQPSEFHTALNHPALALRHPGWWVAYLRGGREELLRRIVADCVQTVRRFPLVGSFRGLASLHPSTPLGLLGAPQEYLYALVRWLRPARVVETGVSRGISSAFILAALNDNDSGQLWSIDLPSTFDRDHTSGEENAPGLDPRSGFVVPANLRARWRLILEDSRTALPRVLAELGSIDLFLHDSDHTYATMTREYLEGFESLRPGGVLASDDIDWNSAFQDFVAGHELADWFTIGRRFGVARRRLDVKPSLA